ncbi:MAG TPA: hypothetical protein VFW71_03145 [Actinomycetota bacterium]|nr:hypothetical protein [Actinomycetota bacterium]
MKTLASQQQENQPIDIEVPVHRLQIMVYRGGQYASVDDVWQSKSVSLDPNTQQPTSQPTNDFVEDSTTLKSLAGMWLVDGTGTFGASTQTVSGTAISYATIPAGQPSSDVRRELQSAFRNFEEVRDSAYKKLDPALLTEVEAQPQLGADEAKLTTQKSQGATIRYDDQDNYRIGLESSGVAWVYDTALDQSATVSQDTGKPLQPVQPRVLRLRFRFSRGANGWLVDGIGGN